MTTVKTTIGQRVKIARKKAGLTQSQLGEKLGFDPLTVSRWERDDSSPEKSLLPIARATGCSPSWLLDGDSTARSSLHSSSRRNIPLIGYAAAGAGATLEMDSEQRTYAPPGAELADFALEVIGDSMEPQISHGDTAYCQLRHIHLPPIESMDDPITIPISQVQPLDGKTVVATFNGLGLLKRLEIEKRRGAPSGEYTVHLISLNKDYKPKKLGRSDDCRIQGVVIGVWRKVR